MNLNAVLVEAITKGAGRVTRKPLAALRRDVSELKRQVAELKRLLRAIQKGGKPRAATAAAPEAGGDGKTPGIRPTGPMVRKVRARMGLTQAEFAKLVGVSTLTVSKWDSAEGRITLRARTLAAFAAVRGIGKRGAKRALSNVET